MKTASLQLRASCDSCHALFLRPVRAAEGAGLGSQLRLRSAAPETLTFHSLAFETTTGTHLYDGVPLRSSCQLNGTARSLPGSTWPPSRARSRELRR